MTDPAASGRVSTIEKPVVLLKIFRSSFFWLPPKCRVGAEEFHPRPLTEPYVTVSRHTARVILNKFLSIPFSSDRTNSGNLVSSS